MERLLGEARNEIFRLMETVCAGDVWAQGGVGWGGVGWGEGSAAHRRRARRTRSSASR
jgi:hypothetical protein